MLMNSSDTYLKYTKNTKTNYKIDKNKYKKWFKTNQQMNQAPESYSNLFIIYLITLSYLNLYHF